jgi:hypothetical protein
MPDDTPTIQYDVFISYKREDQAAAETLRERLIAWGFTVWMDVYCIPAGADWPVEIEKGLRACHTIIAVMTPQAVASQNVQNEWEWGIVHEKRLIPLMLQKCDVPLNLIRKNYIDFMPDQETGFARLKTALESESVPTPPDPYREYLQKLYERINATLAHVIIKINPDDPRQRDPIPLVSERTRGAVDALFEQPDRPLDPMLAMVGMEEKAWESGDFGSAFDYFGGQVMLLGEPGAGKSITLLHFGRDAIVRRVQDATQPVPIWAQISSWDAQRQTPILDWLAGVYGAPPNARQVIEQGRALLLLDGLDELGGERADPKTKERYDPRQRFVKTLSMFVGAYCNTPLQNRIVVTCRVKDYEEIGAKIALRGAVTLKPLSDAQIQAYLSEVPDLWAALAADDALREMARTPLLMGLLAYAYRDQGDEAAQLRDLRNSPGDLRDAIFKRYVEQRYAHEARRLRQRQPPEMLPFTLEEIYEALGRAAMVNTANPFARENALRAHSFGLDDKRRTIFTEMAAQLHLLTGGDKDTFRFIHLLLRDHFGFRFTLPRLSHTDEEIRAIAAEVLGEIGDARAVEPLIAALGDAEAGVRANTAAALGWISDARAVEPLVASMRDAEAKVRIYAAVALGQIGEPAVGSLIAALRDADEGVRVRAAEVLGRIGDARAVAPLISLLADNTNWGPLSRVCDIAAGALERIGTAEAVAAVEAWRKRRTPP